MMGAVKSAMRDADSIVALVDVTHGREELLEMLQPPAQREGPPMLIVLNKIDLVSEGEAEEAKARPPTSSAFYLFHQSACQKVLLAIRPALSTTPRGSSQQDAPAALCLTTSVAAGVVEAELPLRGGDDDVGSRGARRLGGERLDGGAAPGRAHPLSQAPRVSTPGALLHFRNRARARLQAVFSGDPVLDSGERRPVAGLCICLRGTHQGCAPRPCKHELRFEQRYCMLKTAPVGRPNSARALRKRRGTLGSGQHRGDD